MKITFFEVQEWEKDDLKKNFPNAFQTPDKLSKDNAAIFKDSEIISTFIYSDASKEILEAMPSLRLISTRSTGFDHIDIKYCSSKNIIVSNVPEYGSNTVAEHTFALILSLTRKIYQSVNQAKNLNFNHEEIRGVDLFKKTIGIIGLGKIGQNVLRIARGFGMDVIAFDTNKNEDIMEQYEFRYADIDTLLSNSDIVSLHLPLVEKTKHFINKNNILKFKKNSCLINTARGGLIETEAIIVGLNEGILEGVALDVLEEEKELTEEAAILTSEYRDKVNMQNLLYNHILINHPKVLITPHNAFNSKEALDRITSTTIKNMKSFLEGRSINIAR